jgi:hypothetical protein
MEFEGRIPVGALLRVRMGESGGETLVAVVRTDFGPDFVRRYGVACVHGDMLQDLGIKPDSTTEAIDDSLTRRRWPSLKCEIRRWYRALARKAHPDAGGTDEQFRLLQESYEEALAAAAG